jgi:Cu/Ag efflux protein CusF
MQMADGVGARADDAATTTKASATGTIEAIDAAAGKITIAHEPVPSLQWPAMTMEFKAANQSLLKDLRPGTPVSFEFVERQPGEWVVTSIAPAAAKSRPAR